MKFQFISESNETLGLAYRLKEYGHTVYFLNQGKAGEGIFEKRKDRADIVIIDGINIPSDNYSNRLGGSKVVNNLLNSPKYAQLVLSSVNIPLM